ncbi:MAG: DUF1517 domain-containing protein [Myxococcota bacterium]|nr:DUF1517 domain-containing protein [Myxococcota bacterium]
MSRRLGRLLAASLVVASLVAASLVVASLVVAASVSAQSTGSSAGGGSWGSSSGSSSGGSSSSGGYRGGSSSSGAASANSYEPPFGVQCVVAIAFLGLLALIFRGIMHVNAPAKIGVSVLQIAIDARSRRFVQDALGKMVATSDTASRQGLAELLGAAARALSSAKLAWIYAGATRFDPMPQSEARATHGRASHDARSRFQTELVRKVDGTLRTEVAPELVAREHEGEGAVVVTLVVASYAPLVAVDPARVDEIDALLARLAALTPAQLVALALIWSPSAENDRMSTAELEAVYPELTRLVAAVGRVFCTYCAGPHAAELTKCPHCGAPTTRGRPVSANG